MSLIEDWAARLGQSIVHLGAAPELLSPDQTARLKGKLPGRLLMRSIPVIGEESVALARLYDGIADFLLLDSHRASDRQIGALGITHDWRISRRIVDLVRTPVILAGGLGPDNVAEAIRAVRPAGVDSKTRTDRPGPHAPGSHRRISTGCGGSTRRRKRPRLAILSWPKAGLLSRRSVACVSPKRQR